MNTDFYTQQGFLEMQARVQEVLAELANKQGVWLDPGSPVWNDGRMDLPKQGDGCKLTLSSHADSRTVVFSRQELTEFLAGRPSKVRDKLAGAVKSLSTR